MYTIGQVAKKFSLSRSTLLYYDNIGLLPPSARNEANYRLYSERDIMRMERICVFRSAGLPLEVIAEILSLEPSELYNVLEEQLLRIDQDIQQLRKQQSTIVQMLQCEQARSSSRTLNKAQWIELLRATGLSDEDMERWHMEFEAMSPAAHHSFLQSLGINDDEISDIRAISRAGRSPTLKNQPQTPPSVET